MQSVKVTRENWVAVVREAGIRLEVIAVQAGLSFSAVYRYSNGSRTPSDDFIALVARIVEEKTK